VSRGPRCGGSGRRTDECPRHGRRHRRVPGGRKIGNRQGPNSLQSLCGCRCLRSGLVRCPMAGRIRRDNLLWLLGRQGARGRPECLGCGRGERLARGKHDRNRRDAQCPDRRHLRDGPRLYRYRATGPPWLAASVGTAGRWPSSGHLVARRRRIGHARHRFVVGLHRSFERRARRRRREESVGPPGARKALGPGRESVHSESGPPGSSRGIARQPARAPKGSPDGCRRDDRAPGPPGSGQAAGDDQRTQRLAPSPATSPGTRTDLGFQAHGAKLVPNPKDPLYFETAGRSRLRCGWKPRARHQARRLSLVSSCLQHGAGRGRDQRPAGDGPGRPVRCQNAHALHHEDSGDAHHPGCGLAETARRYAHPIVTVRDD
jgi:hypothetical protein